MSNRLCTHAAVKAHPPYLGITWALNSSRSSETGQYRVPPFHFCSLRTPSLQIPVPFHIFSFSLIISLPSNNINFRVLQKQMDHLFSLGVILGTTVFLNFIKTFLPFLQATKKFPWHRFPQNIVWVPFLLDQFYCCFCCHQIIFHVNIFPRCFCFA